MPDDIVCIIPARSGSKGIPGKNLVDFAGQPLLAWSIMAAKNSGAVDRVIVSTDDAAMAAVAREAGAETPFLRPPELARDDVHSVHVVLHALDWLESSGADLPRGVMMLLPTSPLRTAQDVHLAVSMFLEQDAVSVVSVCDLGKYMTNLRNLNGDRLEYVAPEVDRNAQRQGMKMLYGVNGSIFLAKPELLRKHGTFHMEGALGYVMDPLRSIDINSPEDLLLAHRLHEAMAQWDYTDEA
jgi:CMP-N,N'-diacetyllegionaminic acid synthase